MLPAKARVSLAALADDTDRAIARSSENPQDETFRSRQANYLSLAERNSLSVAQAVNEGVHFKGMLAMYTKKLIAGNNLRGIELCASSLKGYLEAVNALFASKGCPMPVNLTDPNS